ncbi:Fic family protein [soil metagenome]
MGVNQGDATTPGALWPSVQYEERDWTVNHPGTLSGTQRRELVGPYQAAITPDIALATVSLPSSVQADAEEATAEIVRFDTEVGHHIAPFTALLLRSESAASSKIENLTASARAIALAELGIAKGTNAPLVVANTRAMEAAIGLAGSLDAAAIITMQATLLDETAPTMTGRFRDQQVWIGGSDYGPHTAMFVPPHHSRVPDAIEDLVAFMGRTDIPALAHIAVAHAQFETIHPFLDGNGRIGRALVHVILRSRGVTRAVTVPVSAGLLTNTPAYFDALTAYRTGDIEPIMVALTDATFASLANGRTLIGELQDIREAWNDSVHARSDSVAWRIADLLVRQPAIDWPTLQRELDPTSPAAYRAIERLLAAGVLIEITGGARHQAWVAPQVLAALDGFATRAGRRGRV